MSFVKDLITLSPDELRARFAIGRTKATGIYSEEEVMDFLIKKSKELKFPKDMTEIDIQTYLTKRKQYNTFVAFIVYNQIFRKNRKNHPILLQTEKSKKSLDFLSLALLYPNNFEKDAAFNMVFYPRKFQYNKEAEAGFTRKQASAMAAVNCLRLYVRDYMIPRRK